MSWPPTPVPVGGLLWVRYLVCPSYRARRAPLVGLSERVACLLAPEEDLGTPVLLDLPAPDGDPANRRLAWVAAAEPRGADGYLLRCRLARPLSPAELAAAGGERAAG